jgi:PTH2 family peptidyl-tRNA hydrolase
MASPQSLAPFLGVWWLEPENSEYPQGLAPRRSTYTLLADREHLHGHVRWADDEGVHQTTYRIDLQGRLSPHARDPEQALSLRMEGGELITERRGPQGLLHRAERRMEGDFMSVVQRVQIEGQWHESRSRYRRTRTKQVMLYRRDLKMRKGKIAAQCAHASMAVFFKRNQGGPAGLDIPLDGPMAEWSLARFAKVVLSVEGEDELMRAHELALELGLPSAVITDSGRTEFHGVPTRTAMAIGPAAREEIDIISGPEGRVSTKLA